MRYLVAMIPDEPETPLEREDFLAVEHDTPRAAALAFVEDPTRYRHPGIHTVAVAEDRADNKHTGGIPIYFRWFRIERRQADGPSI